MLNTSQYKAFLSGSFRNKLNIENKMALLFFIISVLMLSSGCASVGADLKSFLGGAPSTDDNKNPQSYSENAQAPAPQRRYERMTAEKMKNEAGLGERAGSLWTMEGQGSYLFAQNNSRLIGDYLSVTIDGGPKKQLEAKTKVIKDLLDQFEKQRLADSQIGEEGQTAPAAAPAGGNGQARSPAADAQAGKDGATEPDLFNVPSVATRVTDKTKDGNYRVQGEQPYMIGSREYKLVVQGTVRPEDFNEAGVSSEKLLDPHFDIVSK